MMRLILLCASICLATAVATWYIEVDEPYCWIPMDITGEDIGSVPGLAPDKCWAQCEGTSGCKTWTWTYYAHGTCWLKNGLTNTVRANNTGDFFTSVYSGILVEPAPPFTMFQDIDITGLSTWSTVSTASAADCVRHYNQSNSLCDALTWNPGNDACICKRWKEGDHEIDVETPGMIAGESKYLTDLWYIYEKNTDYSGNDIGSVPSNYYDTCDGECNAYTSPSGEKCHAWTWTDYNGGTCWLKSQKTASSPNPNSISAHALKKVELR